MPDEACHRRTPVSQTITQEIDADRRRWLGLIVLLAGAFLPPLDFFIVNVALPSIRDDFQASSSMMQLVVSAYATTYAVMLITGGRLGDLYGRRNTFLWGMGMFAAASLLCGASWSPVSLVAGRVLQGFSAAIMAPQALASINAIFPDDEKPQALSLYSLTFGLASMAGLFLGGALIALDIFGLGWRAIFLINIPVIAIAIPSAYSLLKETRSERPKRLDVGGAVLIAATLAALIVPLIEGREAGWPAWSFISLACVLPLGLVLWRYELRLEAEGLDPIFAPSLLRTSGLKKGLLAALLFYALAAFWLVFSVYQQAGLGHSPFQAGLSILPAAAGFIVGPLVNPWLARRAGKYAAATGMLFQVFGLVYTAVLVARGSPDLPLPLFLIGMGQGVGLPNLVGNIVKLVDRQSSGLASGLVTSMFQISGALSVAIIGGLFFGLAGGAQDRQMIANAYATSAIVIAACIFIAAVLSVALPKRQHT
ncbi:MFS transporter [Rhizobium leguminosarum]|nr:MFS transporter [Rhizobium leguminosarum]NEH73442.1 MFS transporter [Rhizobium leguminosarum]